MKKIRMPLELTTRQGKRGKTKTCTIDEVIPYLPDKTCVFDIRHLVWDNDIMPFSVTTRVNANMQQYVKIMNEDVKTNVVGMLGGDKWSRIQEHARRVYGTDGVAPTQNAHSGGCLETKILEPINNNNMEQQEEPKIGAIRTRSYCGQPAKLEEGGSEHSNCITSVDKDNVVVEPINATADGLATTLTTAHHYSGNIVNPKRGQTEMGVKETDSNMKFRIRKLTPRECFRLMDVDDADIDKIQAAGISKSRQYCLAGNSIASLVYIIFSENCL